jgi:hypothetical protein
MESRTPGIRLQPTEEDFCRLSRRGARVSGNDSEAYQSCSTHPQHPRKSVNKFIRKFVSNLGKVFEPKKKKRETGTSSRESLISYFQ